MKADRLVGNESYSKVYIIEKLLANINGVVPEGCDETTTVRDTEPDGQVP